MRHLTGIMLVAVALSGCSGGSGKPHTAGSTTSPPAAACPGYADASTTFQTFKGGMADGSVSAAQGDVLLQKLSTQLGVVAGSSNPTVQNAAQAAGQDATKLDAALTSGDNSQVSATAGDLNTQMTALAAYC